MNLIFYGALVNSLLQISILAVTFYRRKRLSRTIFLLICVLIVTFLVQGFVMRYILTLAPKLRVELGEFFSAFYQDWYFVLFHLVILFGVIFLYPFKWQGKHQ